MRYSEEQYIHEVCKNIKRIRKGKKLTQEEVAFASNMDEPSFRRIENGKTNPTLRSLVRVCKAMDIELEELFVFED